jgi:hypothetical protein
LEKKFEILLAFDTMGQFHLHFYKKKTFTRTDPKAEKDTNDLIVFLRSWDLHE